MKVTKTDRIARKQKRESIGVSRVKLAELMGVNRSTVARLEDGDILDPPTPTVSAWARALDELEALDTRAKIRKAIDVGVNADEGEETCSDSTPQA